MAKTEISRMRADTWNGITDQNGHNPFPYRVYDNDGRIVASKEGIVTVPTEMQPRSRLVPKNVDAYEPKVTDSTNPIKAFIK